MNSGGDNAPDRIFVERWLPGDGARVPVGFRVRERRAGEPFYKIENFSLAGGEVRSSLGMSVGTRPLGARVAIDTWIAAGVTTIRSPRCRLPKCSRSCARRRRARDASQVSARAALSWLKRGCSRTGARPRIGPLPAR